MAKNSKIIVTKIFFLTLVFFVLFSCRKNRIKDQSDFQFYIEDVDIYVTTSKHIDNKFYVIFSKSDSLEVASPNTDYVEFQIENTPINIIFDSINRHNIYVLNELNNIKSLNQNKFKIEVLNHKEFESKFFEPRIKTSPPQIKPKYIQLTIGSLQYGIVLKNKIIKESDIYGGW